MLINPISQNPVAQNFRGGLKPEVAKNRLRVLFTQDIWAEKLSVRMPQSIEEKDVLLEVLQNRLKLDRFTRLSNQKFKLNGLLKYAKFLTETNPEHKDLPEVEKEIAKQGNIEAVFKTLNKNIQLEQNKNKQAIDYFKNIEKIEEEYCQNKLVKDSHLNKFWTGIKKHNINSDGQYSTKDLLEIISGKKSLETAKIEKTASQILPKKQLLARIEKDYELTLRQNINIYEHKSNRYNDAIEARKIVEEKYRDSINYYPGIDKLLAKTYNFIESKMRYKINKIADAEKDIHPLNIVLDDMAKRCNSMKEVKNHIAQIKRLLAENPDNPELKAELLKAEQALEDLKLDWTARLVCSVEFENENNEILTNAGCGFEYEFLTKENKTIKRNKELYEMFKQNKNSFPDEIWNEIIK